MSYLKTLVSIISILLLLCIQLAASAATIIRHKGWHSIGQDYKNFYGKKSMIQLGVVTAIGAVFANTSLDQDITDSIKTLPIGINPMYAATPPTAYPFG